MKHHLPLIFDSDRLPPKQRLPFVREEFGRKVLQVDLQTDSDGPFHCRLWADWFGDTRIAAIETSTLTNSRDRRIVSNHDDGIGFVIPLRGRYMAGHNGISRPLLPGQVMAMSNSQPGAVTCVERGAFLTVVTSRQNLLPLLNKANFKFGELLDYHGQGLTMLHAYLRFMAHVSPGMAGAGREFIGRQIAELLAFGLGNSRDTSQEGGGDGLMVARMASIHSEIDDHFSEPSFNVAQCAAKLGLSVRYIQALCERNDTNFTAELKRRRLSKAQRILSDPANNDIAITDIALDCGFGDISHFNRTFRSAFGDSPSGVRNSGKI
jgi:AraC-like DNA-binding protein